MKSLVITGALHKASSHTNTSSHFLPCTSALISTDCKIEPVKNSEWWCELTRGATRCLIHNLEAAQSSRAQASHIHYSCFLLSPTLPVMEIKDPLLDEEQ